MATIINNPSGSGEGSGVGVIIGILVAIVLIILFFAYGLPALRGNPAPANPGIDVNVDLPSPGGEGAPAN